MKLHAELGILGILAAEQSEVRGVKSRHPFVFVNTGSLSLSVSLSAAVMLFQTQRGPVREKSVQNIIMSNSHHDSVP